MSQTGQDSVILVVLARVAVLRSFFFFQAEDGIRDYKVTGVQTCALPISSGGPFRKTPLAALQTVTPEQALAHPNWRMGNRITIDSATMMNKGFEIIEARWLFGVQPNQIDVVIHPQSTVHSKIGRASCRERV